MRFSLLATAALSVAAPLVTRKNGLGANLPVRPLRGVNLGGLFIVEPWMMSNEWRKMGCSAYGDEWSCMQGTGGSVQGNFITHWNSWITQADINQIAAWGLNTVRIPVGHWIVEGSINSGEPWARGGFKYLKQLLRWCNQAGLWAIIDLHGAPNAQTANQAFTGHSVSSPGFYNADDFGRARLWAWNITTSKYTDPDFANVFAIEVVNEPASGHPNLISDYYPGVYGVIRGRENELGIHCGSTNLNKRVLEDRGFEKRAYSDCLNIVYMDAWWGAGDPSTNLPDGYTHVIFDNHRYFAYNPNADQTRSQVIADSCNTHPVTDNPQPVMFGEFSLALTNQNGDFSINSNGGLQFYQQYIGSQIHTYEQGAGWTFWTYKNELGFDWNYAAAVNQGIIPTQASRIASQSAC